MSCEKNGHYVKDEKLLKNGSMKARIQMSMQPLMHGLPLLLDKVLSKWPNVKIKAEELAKLLGHDFKATDEWLSQWKSRHDIQFNKAQGEKESTDSASGRNGNQQNCPSF